MLRICFLTCSPFSRRDNKRYAIERFKEASCEVIVLDCTPFLNRRFEKYISGQLLCVESFEVIRCHSLLDTIRHMQLFGQDWTVDMLGGYNKRSYIITLELKQFQKILFQSQLILDLMLALLQTVEQHPI